MGYAAEAVERAMRRQEVILQGMSGKYTWWQVAEILNVSPRTVRRWRRWWQKSGYRGLFDRRRQTPSPKRAPLEAVERVLSLYRERYTGFNVRHFHEIARREHGVKLSYSFVKKALQEAGLVKKYKSCGRHRRRREPRPCRGELLHLDGSPHAWLAQVPDERQTLIAVRLLCPWAGWTWIRSSASKRNVSSARTTPSSSASCGCSWTSRPGAGPAPPCACWFAGIWTARIRCGEGHNVSADSPQKEKRAGFGLWKLPALWTLENAPTGALDAC
ncbi:MAG TPA: helix-turn-helix domain-containing protein [Candidatus Polarisedimenticolia bacterium]|jgi:transposase|nr:helix-turn-helix domain-containing protein [Candidatus Polarisedimenticolia bacterium]